MVRSLVMFFGVCLLVPASGCFFEESGSGGSSGGGGAATDACTNENDMAVVCDAGFGDTLATCATDAGGQGAETADCLVTEGLTTDCADCYGAATQCTFDQCLSECSSDPTSDECVTCREDNCIPAFDACTGEVDCSGGTGGTDGDGGGGGNGGNDGGGGNGGNGGNDGGGGAG